MNRKNLTAAVLAALAGAAGIAGTAQAVNINPDGTGQVLLYPYYTANDGNQTVLSVVNTTEQAKAVKVRFLEGFNSREVLDFNLYLSAFDVWVAAIASAQDLGIPTVGDETIPYLKIPDSSCTVPYLYGWGVENGNDYGLQEFLSLAYAGVLVDDGGPQTIGRAAEGHFEIIEMGTLTNGSAIPADPDAEPPVPETLGSAAQVTHGVDGLPADCWALTDKWTENGDPTKSGIWFKEAQTGDGQATTDTIRNSGGLFGTAAVINSENGTMYSYDATAIQGFDDTSDGIHYIPGGVRPSLNSGSQTDAWVFFGVPQNTSVMLDYDTSVDAVSAVLMHENIMNEYTIEDDLNAATEWIVTFPTKNFYADYDRMVTAGLAPKEVICEDDEDDPDYDPECEDVLAEPREPFNTLFAETNKAGDPVCEVVGLKTWDREEATFTPDAVVPGTRPPVVSPSIPDCDPSLGDADCQPDEVQFQLCNEVNVLRFGEESIFGTPDFGDDGSLLISVDNEYGSGWGWINFGGSDRLLVDDDGAALVGLPVAGFAAWEVENDFVDGGDVKANYGGLFKHKANVRGVSDDR